MLDPYIDLLQLNKRNWLCPLAAMVFDGSKICLEIFVEGHLVVISAKLFKIMTTGFRGEYF